MTDPWTEQAMSEAAEPWIIGENCFPDAVSLPPELQDRGLEYPPEVQAVLKEAADKLAEDFSKWLDENVHPVGLNDIMTEWLVSKGWPRDRIVVDAAVDLATGVADVHVNYRFDAPLEFITINLKEPGDGDAEVQTVEQDSGASED